jgi:hypothetical protein
MSLNYRLIFSLVGCQVNCTVKTGAIYTGLFHTANTHDSLGVCLKTARRVDANGKSIGQVIQTLVILGKDVVAISVATLDLKTEGTGVFKTDGAISGASAEGSSRQLEKWGDSASGSEISMQLDTPVSIDFSY